MTRISLVTLAAAVVLVAVPHAEIIEQVLVKVNGDILSKTELEQRQVAAIRQMGTQNTRQTDAQLRRMLDDLTPDLLVDVVDEMLLVQRGRELGLKLSDEQFKSAVDNIKKENKIENEAQFEAALKQERMTMTELRQGLERQMLVQGVRRNEVLGRIGVTEEEARRYYDAHVTEFTTSPSVTLREILVTNTGGVGDPAAKEKADQIRQRVLNGESFEKLASEVSDAPSKTNAGLIGPLNVDDLSPDLKSLVTSMKSGDVSAVLKTATGYQLLKVETLSAPDTKPFAQAKTDIENRIYDDKSREETEKYLQKLRSQAIIEWKNADLKKAYETGLEARAKNGPPPTPAAPPSPAASPVPAK